LLIKFNHRKKADYYRVLILLRILKSMVIWFNQFSN